MATRYVNTASSPGGDGTTNNTAGATRAYACLSDAEAGLPADITTGGDQGIWTIICEGTTADTTAVTFAGTTTSATYYIEVKAVSSAAAGRHKGEYSTSYYRLAPSGGVTAIYINTDRYMRFVGLQIRSTPTDNTTASCIYDDYWNQATFYIDGCLFYLDVSVSSSCSGYCIHSDYVGNESTWYIQNCAFYATSNNQTGANVTRGVSEGNFYAGNIYVYNCTFNNLELGILSTSASTPITVRNCGFANCTTSTSGTMKATQTNSTSAPTFDTGKTFHLASGDTTWKDQGTDLSGTTGIINSLDIDEQTRSGTWDIGADEYVAAVTGNPWYYYAQQ